jgi:hypothetical protein
MAGEVESRGIECMSSKIEKRRADNDQKERRVWRSRMIQWGDDPSR